MSYIDEVEEVKKDLDFNLHIFTIKDIKVYKSIHNKVNFGFNKKEYFIFDDEDEIYSWRRRNLKLRINNIFKK